MRTTTQVIYILASLTLLLGASGCKRNQSANVEQAAEEQAAADVDATKPATDAPAAEGAPPAGARLIAGMPLPEGWFKLSATTPKGATISFGVPGGWVEARPPNDSTLLVRVAPMDSPAAGTKATAVAPAYDGGLEDLVKHTRLRLQGFAAIKGDGPIRVGNLDGHEFVASWATPVGNRDTAQLVFATGEESIGITCQMPPEKLEELGPLCDEIFATLAIEGVTLQP